MFETVTSDAVTTRSWVNTRETAHPWDLIHPHEQSLVLTASAKRQHEFAAARVCAHQALKEIYADIPVLHKSSGGAPLWPQGVVGSLTHCEGLRAAVVASHSDLRSVGIDAEPHSALPAGVLDTVALPAEKAEIITRGGVGGVHWDKVLFSAKEAVYKTWNPLTRTWLGFHDAHIMLSDPVTAVRQSLIGSADSLTTYVHGSFQVQVLSDDPAHDTTQPVHELNGRYAVLHDFVLAAIELKH